MLSGSSLKVNFTQDLTRSLGGLLCKQTERGARIPQLDRVELRASADAPLFLDLRPASLFARGFIPGSINVSTPNCLQVLSRFPEFTSEPCYVIAGSAVNRQAARGLFDSYKGIRVAGWLRPAVVREWSRRRGALATFEELEPDSLAVRIASAKTVVVDVRERLSFAAGHIPDALHISPDALRDSLAGLPEGTSLSLVCGSGDLAGFAASLLHRIGYKNLAILRGGLNAYAGLGLSVVRPSVPAALD